MSCLRHCRPAKRDRQPAYPFGSMRARNGTLTLQAIVGKFVAAVDEDIDPENADSIFCAMSCRCNPVKDTHG